MSGVKGTGMMNCPFCAGRSLEINYTMGGKPFVRCRKYNCLSEGPTADTELEAVQRWNKRREGKFFRAGYLVDAETLNIEADSLEQATKQALGLVPNQDTNVEKRY